MNSGSRGPVDVLIVAVPETAGSALYGMLDVLSAAGSIWQTLARAGGEQKLFRVRIVSPQGDPFVCGNGIPVQPDCSVADDPDAPIVILPEIWLGPDESWDGRHPALIEWISRKYREGATLYSACSGAVMLAETGLLDGLSATSHWGYRDLFTRRYPKVRFDPAPNLVYAGPEARIVTAGGTTSWHDLALHIIARHASPGEALRIAKVYLLKWHAEGQLPYATLVRRAPHADSVVRRCEVWLGEHFRELDAISKVVALSGIPERTLKRRFKAATGSPLIEYLQNLRIEEAKRLLESSALPVDEISAEAGYADSSFLRRLFKKSTGLTPSQYRRMFKPLAAEGAPESVWTSGVSGA
ncbi:MAG TPA: helix-turn-helix domain-containing protein [Gammaproteobacteria bacterium]|nr:helix-turn-helix domain-containing protein [Gammaproteobacteria bacterium]